MAKKQPALDKFIDEHIIKETLEDIVGDRFGRYSKYIIQDRALPDVRDGLKPVQRRILYAMQQLGLTNDKPYKKAARIVGDVIGKYHPHGDSSVYEAMVRLSQEWKIRLPLIDMHGNKGSLDGDPPAAMRYTEARMAKASELLLKDIDKRTVSFAPNFDDEEYEPVVLPARFPNLLINGASGISAGYATEIPPHNLAEVIKGVIKRIDKPDVTLDEMMRIIQGPDFPTGGIVQGVDGIKEAFETGRGRIIIKSKTRVEGDQIIIDELPYEVNKATLVRKIDELRNQKKVDGIIEVRDESDQEGLRIVIDIKKTFDPEAILNFLHKKTDLTKSYHYNMVAIHEKRPCQLGLLAILDAYVYHQKEVTTNRANYDLRKAQSRLHIVEGIVKMTDVLDEVIRLIRQSKDKKTAKEQLQKKLSFSELQAEAILTLQLYRLSNTDVTALSKEATELSHRIETLKDVLHNEASLEQVIKEELREVLKLLKTPRLSEIESTIERITIKEDALVQAETMRLGLTKEGYVRLASLRSYNATEDPTIKEGDTFILNQQVSTLDTLLIFTASGQYIYLPVFKLPETRWKDIGVHLNTLLQLDLNESFVHIEIVENFDTDDHLLLTTSDNLVKLTPLSQYQAIRYNRPLRAISLGDNATLVDVRRVDDLSDEVLTIATSGVALRYDLTEIPITNLNAKGVKAMKLGPKDSLAASVPLKDHHDLLILTQRGTIKRIDLSELDKKRRTLTGMPLYKTLKSNPYKVMDARLLSGLEYKHRATVRVITDRGYCDVSAFDIKRQAADAGKQYIRLKHGMPSTLTILPLELTEDEAFIPLSDYQKVKTLPARQQSLFDEE